MTTVSSGWQISRGGVNGWYNSTNITMTVLNNDWVRFTYTISMKHSKNFSWTNGSQNYTKVQLATSNGTNIRTDNHDIGRVGYKDTRWGPNETSWGPYIMDFRRESADKTVAARSMIHVNAGCPGNQWTGWAWFTIPAKPKPKPPAYVAPKKPSITNTNLSIPQGTKLTVSYSRDKSGTAGSENHISLFSKTGVNVGTADPKDKSKIEWKNVSSSNTSGSFTAFDPVSWVTNKNYNPYKKYSLDLMVADYRLINGSWKRINSNIKTFTLLAKEKPKINFPTILNANIKANSLSWTISTTALPKEQCYFNIVVYQDVDQSQNKKDIYHTNNILVNKSTTSYSTTFDPALIQDNHMYSFDINIVAKDTKYNETLDSSPIVKSNKYYSKPIAPLFSGQLYNNQVVVNTNNQYVNYATGYRVICNNQPPVTVSKDQKQVIIPNIATEQATVKVQSIGFKNTPETANDSNLSSAIINKQASKYRLFYHSDSARFLFNQQIQKTKTGSLIQINDACADLPAKIIVQGKTVTNVQKDFSCVQQITINISDGTQTNPIQLPINLQTQKLYSLPSGVYDELVITRGHIQLIKRIQESDPSILYGTTYSSWEQSNEIGHLNPLYVDSQGNNKPGTLEPDLVLVSQQLSQKPKEEILDLGYVDLPMLFVPNTNIWIDSNLGRLETTVTYNTSANKIIVTSN